MGVQLPDFKVYLLSFLRAQERTKEVRPASDSPAGSLNCA